MQFQGLTVKTVFSFFPNAKYAVFSDASFTTRQYAIGIILLSRTASKTVVFGLTGKRKELKGKHPEIAGIEKAQELAEKHFGSLKGVFISDYPSPKTIKIPSKNNKEADYLANLARKNNVSFAYYPARNEIVRIKGHKSALIHVKKELFSSPHILQLIGKEELAPLKEQMLSLLQILHRKANKTRKDNKKQLLLKLIKKLERIENLPEQERERVFSQVCSLVSTKKCGIPKIIREIKKFSQKVPNPS